MLTNMKRVTVALPDEIDQKILDLKKQDKYVRESYSEVVRMALEVGLKTLYKNA